MALQKVKEEPSRIDEQTALKRPDRQPIKEHRHLGHDFAMDLHPERYPRESLNRLEEGILEDDELRHAEDRLGYRGPDLEARVDDIRNQSRTLIVLGSCVLIYAGVLLLWVGWDVRSGNAFFSTMCTVSAVIGLGLILWGYLERGRVKDLRARIALGAEGEGERIPRLIRGNDSAR